MGQKFTDRTMTPEEARRILAEGGHLLTPDADYHVANWTDGLPHDSGWGPQTQDPDHPVRPVTPIDLQWSGEGSTDRHHVWRFDLRRRQH